MKKNTNQKLFKKKHKQKLYKRPKRTNFFKLFAKGAVCCLLATAVFAGVLAKIKSRDIYEQVQKELASRKAEFLVRFNNHDNGDINYNNKNLDIHMGLYTHYNAMLDDGDLASILREDFEYLQYASQHTRNCYALSAILDENQNILYSSKQRLTTVIKFEQEDTSSRAGLYACEVEEIPELYQVYQEMKGDTDSYVSIQVKSAYVDTEHHKFIPHEAELILEHFDSTTYIVTDATRNVTIDFEHPDYELVTLHSVNRGSEKQQYPTALTANFHGTEESVFNELISEISEQIGYVIKNENSVSNGMQGISSTARIYYTVVPIWMNGEKNYLAIVFQIDLWNDYVEKIYLKIVGIFFLLTLLIDLIYSLHKNKINQLAYQFEDYQRTLINNLAHDLKTPLMAINGYTENLLTSCKMEKEPKEYLQSILENVKYTDSVINQTLELNRIQEIKDLQKSVCNLNDITEKALRKYELLLDEQQITVTSVGDAEIMANLETLIFAIENLISNAVKYTPLGGEINIQINNKSLRIDNSVTGKTETSALLLPFTKGDKSRTGKSGSGLGLTIAENALRANGFKLEISCTDNEFTAEIHF